MKRGDVPFRFVVVDIRNRFFYTAFVWRVVGPHLACVNGVGESITPSAFFMGDMSAVTGIAFLLLIKPIRGYEVFRKCRGEAEKWME